MAELGVHQPALLTDLALCINRYRLFSPGWYVCVMAKVQLSADEWEVPIYGQEANFARPYVAAGAFAAGGCVGAGASTA
jgi:hypothetical protein